MNKYLENLKTAIDTKHVSEISCALVGNIDFEELIKRLDKTSINFSNYFLGLFKVLANCLHF